MLRAVGSRHKNPGWQGQYDRCKRWHDRVKQIGFHKTESGDTELFLDYIYAFFMNCDHLRNWLQYSAGISQDTLIQFINSYPEMQICRDISNGVKHFNIDRNPRDKEFAIGREYAPGSRPYLNETYFIISKSDKYDLFHLADRCMELWGKFLADQGLL